MAGSDLESWRQTAEIVQLISDAHLAAEKMKSVIRPIVDDIKVCSDAVSCDCLECARNS